MVNSNAEAVIKKIKELPPLPLVVQKLLTVVGDDGTSATDLTKVISTDQALVGRLLKLVNSSFYGFPGRVSTITRAVVILGFSAIRNLALGLSAYETMKKVRGPVDWEGFWQHAMTCGCGAQAFALKMKYSEPEEAFVAGLLHDIGHFVLNVALPDEFANILETAHGGLLEKQKEILGMGHTEAGIQLLEHWKLPEQLCRTARFHHSPKLACTKKEPLLTAVMLADVLATVEGSRYVEGADTGVLHELTQTAGISLKECSSLLVDIKKRLGEAKDFLQIAEEATPSDTEVLKQEEMATIVIASLDNERLEWVKTLLEYFGYHVLPMNTLTQQGEGCEQVSLVILDSANLKEEQLTKFGDLLDKMHIRPLLLTDDGHIPDTTPSTLRHCTAIPFVFSKYNIQCAIQEEAK